MRPAARSIFGGTSLLCLALWATDALAVDPSQFCSPTAPNVVLYLDVTTPYDDIDKRTLVDGVSEIFASLKGGERVVIRTIADEFSRSRRLLEMCAPFCESRGLIHDLFISDCTEGVLINERKKMKARMAETFRAAMSSSGNLPYSEIIRTLARSSSEEYRGGRQNDLYIFSDLIENSRYMPGKTFLWTAPAVLIQSIQADGQIPDLSGAAIQVFGVGRSGAGERGALTQELLSRIEEFWRAYFTKAGATLTMQQNLSLSGR